MRSFSKNNIALLLDYPANWLLPLDAREILTVLQHMFTHANNLLQTQTLAGIELHLVDDWTISKANTTFLSSTGPTNILSFPGGHDLYGVLLLSLDTFERECLLYGQEHTEHFLRLLAHGLGHLAGLDHGSEMDQFCQVCYQAGIQQIGLLNHETL